MKIATIILAIVLTGLALNYMGSGKLGAPAAQFANFVRDGFAK